MHQQPLQLNLNSYQGKGGGSYAAAPGGGSYAAAPGVNVPALVVGAPPSRPVLAARVPGSSFVAQPLRSGLDSQGPMSSRKLGAMPVYGQPATKSLPAPVLRSSPAKAGGVVSGSWGTKPTTPKMTASNEPRSPTARVQSQTSYRSDFSADTVQTRNSDATSPGTSNNRAVQSNQERQAVLRQKAEQIRKSDVKETSSPKNVGATAPPVEANKEPMPIPQRISLPDTNGTEVPVNEEGGSHKAGLHRRLSSNVDDIVNDRESFKGKPSEASSTWGCFDGLREMLRPAEPAEEVDVVLVGGGIMSATVGLLLKQLEPSWKIVICERLGAVAMESSNGWNNAGTGHSALCEPNYTPAKGDTVDISKAVTVNENFQLSRQYWSHLVQTGLIKDPENFINVTPHMTFVHGDEHVDWCKKRFEALVKHPLFQGMEYTEDKKKMSEWAPIMMEGRDPDEKCAMTRVPYGTDVDFGELTRNLTKAFMSLGGIVRLFTEVTDLKRVDGALYDGAWSVTTKDSKGSCRKQYSAKFVFVGAGGYALPLLQRSGIPEIRGFMGFPISGEFLVCQNPEVALRHKNKVYGKAAIGAPPMSVPHLDSRTIGGQPLVLFGPFAGFSPRFLKSGSLLDLFKSIRTHNILPAAAAGLQNLDLTVYLVKQLMASKSKKLSELREFMPNAKDEDWTLVTAGQRVQIMKKDPNKIGVLQFGTEVVSAEDGSIAGLLGASPGASTAVQVALDVVAKCFPKEFETWTPKIQEMIPSFGTRLSDNPAFAAHLHRDSAASLGIS
eukprot:TRINITY_DN3085_c0_g1_i1.p1 TRINITY_DN3085_c0_g1~~TRINITY_DN3085_c0_g1_i1.p1  ORF type:complete len:789 (+),score=149.81 TRINITY_DN3085_c0_g1_i1:28-2367(+)